MTWLFRKLRYMLERWVQRGVLNQLLLMAVLVVSVAAFGGLIAWGVTDKFANAWEGIWWAFLRLTDPGYLGDDEGMALRTISTTVTVLGYVLFMGSLIAIMTQWLTKTIRDLERGATPIVMHGHVVVLGWTNRTPEIVRVLLNAGGRAQRFLRRNDVRLLRIVILADTVDAGRRQELREALGDDWDERRVILKSGSSQRPGHLERLKINRAAAVLVPGADFELGGSEMTDTRVIKTLLTVQCALAAIPDQSDRPTVVTEVFDPKKRDLVQSSIAGSEVIASDELVAQLASQFIQDPVAAHVLMGLFSHSEGNSVYIRDVPELVGQPLHSLTKRFRQSIPVGVMDSADSESRCCWDVSSEQILTDSDTIIFLSERYSNCQFSIQGTSSEATTSTPKAQLDFANFSRSTRVLIMGWSSKVASVLNEINQQPGTQFEISIISKVPEIDRERELRLSGFIAGEHISVVHIHDDYAAEHVLRGLDPAGYDRILFLASAWMETSEEADARTILGRVLLNSILDPIHFKPSILVEFADPSNTEVLHIEDDFIVPTPRFLSHLLANIAMRPELIHVHRALLGARHPKIAIRPFIGLAPANEKITFQQIQELASKFGSTAIGVCEFGKVVLNPTRDQSWDINSNFAVVLLENSQHADGVVHHA